MNLIKRKFAELNGWKKCRPPEWFDEFRLRRKIDFPDEFSIKGKTFKYRAIKIVPYLKQGDTLCSNYEWFKMKRGHKK